MAIRFDALGERLARTTGLPSITAWTIMGWIQLSVDQNAEAAFYGFGAANGNDYLVGALSDGTTLKAYNGSFDVSGSTLSVNTWYHIASTVAGTGAGQYLTYLNGVLNITHSGNGSSSAVRMTIADDQLFSLFLNGRVAAVKVYGAVLTAAEISVEMRQYVPVRWTNLNGFYPLFNSGHTADQSGNGNNWTVNGTLTTQEGPPIPWRLGLNRGMSAVAAAAAPARPPLQLNRSHAPFRAAHY